jgi:two-component system KDP operon response regulator KdpE
MLRRSALVVEDDAELRRVFRVALSFDGFVVFEASNGLDALRTIDRLLPDVIVLDLGLPAVDGQEVLRELSAHSHTRGIPIVVVTGSTDNLDHLHVACVLRKPFTVDRLLHAVGACLASRPRQSGV